MVWRGDAMTTVKNGAAFDAEHDEPHKNKKMRELAAEIIDMLESIEQGVAIKKIGLHDLKLVSLVAQNAYALHRLAEDYFYEVTGNG